MNIAILEEIKNIYKNKLFKQVEAYEKSLETIVREKKEDDIKIQNLLEDLLDVENKPILSDLPKANKNDQPLRNFESAIKKLNNHIDSTYRLMKENATIQQRQFVIESLHNSANSIFESNLSKLSKRKEILKNSLDNQIDEKEKHRIELENTYRKLINQSKVDHYRQATETTKMLIANLVNSIKVRAVEENYLSKYLDP
ncbi:hypothetical protein TRFO_32908 [Tritrichomonas foetus]|uniref:Uncharacterized protein n=1 Tax=Tritrichomonas foetus TaxID=1144522 RepID=A0A1J4JNV6_9EUKA|nr:hypothetical protein TRFO_32908 [Tritrichomonas foetus]|eukprot:OHT00410.1 hypothetical protein TRFO_32908 [Tritrichomonas foetus]